MSDNKRLTVFAKNDLPLAWSADSMYYIYKDSNMYHYITGTGGTPYLVSCNSGTTTDITLSGTNYVYVNADGTPTENATTLQSNYDFAKTLPLTSANTFTLLLSPGVYETATGFSADTEWINISSVNGERSVLFKTTTDPAVWDSGIEYLTNIIPSFKVINNNITITGIVGETVDSNGWACHKESTTVAYTLPFQNSIDLSGDITGVTFVNCEGGVTSFGGDMTHINYNVQNRNINVDVYNCKGDDYSFGCLSSALTGNFYDSESGDYSFGFQNTTDPTHATRIINGNYYNCKGGDNSFGAYQISDGYYEKCEGGTNSFGGSYTGEAKGTYYYCVGTSNAFGGDKGKFSGIARYCVGGVNSFGFGTGGVLTGQLYFCHKTSGLFENPVTTGEIKACVDGNGNLISIGEINKGSASFNSLSANTIYSGTTNLYDIFATAGDVGDITRVQYGLNTYTGGTANNPTINISGATLDNLNVSGETSLGSISATTIISGTTNLYDIFGVGGGGHTIFSQTSVTGLTQRENLRFVDYLKASDDDPDTKVEIDATKLLELVSTYFIEDSGELKLRLFDGRIYEGNTSDFAEAQQFYDVLDKHINTDYFTITLNKLKPTNTVIALDILTSTGNTANAALSFLDWDGSTINHILAKYKVTDIILEETSGNNAGNISIGTTSGGTEVVNSQTVNASEVIHAPLGTTFFSVSANQILYISSSSWGSGVIKATVSIQLIYN